MKLTGTAKRLNGSVFYSVRDNGYYMCGGVAMYVLCGIYDDDQIMAWGYDGCAPNITSVGLLTFTLGNFKTCYEFSWGNFASIEYRDKVMELYRLFTQQVVSKLPDNWEMTTSEIKAWIKNHKKLPACIKQQNQRKHGKAKAEKEGSVV